MLEGEDCDRDADLGALLVVVRRLLSTQRQEPVLSRGGRSTCMSTCRGLRERPNWTSVKWFTNVHSSSNSVHEELYVQESKGGRG